MRELPLRLGPGADLRRALEESAHAHFPHGTFVLCGIGSLENPRLRLAQKDNEDCFAGPHEILTLAGTITTQGAHLHMSLSSSTGSVLGGHVVYGNIVRTTVEVFLVQASGWALSRELDPSTGFLELKTTPLGGAESAA